jgi:hypothetical protein
MSTTASTRHSPLGCRSDPGAQQGLPTARGPLPAADLSVRSGQKARGSSEGTQEKTLGRSKERLTTLIRSRDGNRRAGRT